MRICAYVCRTVRVCLCMCVCVGGVLKGDRCAFMPSVKAHNVIVVKLLPALPSSPLFPCQVREGTVMDLEEGFAGHMQWEVVAAVSDMGVRGTCC